MKLFGTSKSNSNKKDDKTILFVCVENAGRSQMAEGFFKKYAPEVLIFRKDNENVVFPLFIPNFLFK